VKARLADVWLLTAVVGILVFGIYALWFPSYIDYAEGPLCDQARRLLEGHMLYRADLAQPPYTVDNYPPLYPLVVASLVRVSGLSLLCAGRLVSLLAAVAATALIARLARRDGDDRATGRLAAALFLSHFFVVEWAIVARVDVLALALSLGALAIVQARPRAPAAALAAARALANAASASMPAGPIQSPARYRCAMPPT